MLIRISGGSDGIAQYLTQGQMRGRFFERDELDKRIVLAGDLEFVDELIQSMEVSGGVERYNHITLSLREDYVDPATLLQISEDFREFAFAAYDRDEYAFYSEAHVPRIKSYHDSRTGALVERKPHIHIVIPRINPMDGTDVNPFGLVKFTEKFIDAFQEYVNEKYGLASPKDHRRKGTEREPLAGRAEALARYTGIDFKGQGVEIKKQLLALMAEQDRPFSDLAEVAVFAKSFGAVTVRNAGTDRAYLNIKPAGAERGINLKETVFCPAANAPDAGQGKPKKKGIDVLTDWRETASKETRYLQRAGRWYREVYRPAHNEKRKELLTEKENERHERQRNLHAFSNDRSYEAISADLRAASDYLGSAQQNSGIAGEGRGAWLRGDIARAVRGIFESRGRWSENALGSSSLGLTESPQNAVARSTASLVREFSATLPAVNTASLAQLSRRLDTADQALAKHLHTPLRRDTAVIAGEIAKALQKVSTARAVRPDKHLDAANALLLQAVNRVSVLSGPRVTLAREIAAAIAIDSPEGLLGMPRVPDGFTPANAQLHDRLFCEAAAASAARSDPDRAMFAEIRRRLDGTALLNYVSLTHGVTPERFEVTKGRDGSDRIRAAGSNRNLNVSDFLTRELHLPFEVAGPILKHAYALQLQRQPFEKRPIPNVSLMEAYKQTRVAEVSSTQTKVGALRETKKLAMENSYRQFLSDRGKLLSDRGLKGLSKRTEMSKLRMARAQSEQLARFNFEAQMTALQSERKPFFQGYLSWLEDRANEGDEAPVLELRRMQVPTARNEGDTDLMGVNAASQTPLKFPIHKNLMTHRAERNGDVSWAANGKTVLIDRVDRITVLDRQDDNIEIALRLAMQRFRGPLQIGGSEAFRRQVVEAAVRGQLHAQFSNVDMLAYQRELMTMNKAGRRGTGQSKSYRER